MTLTNQQLEAAIRRYDRLMEALGLEEDTVNGRASMLSNEEKSKVNAKFLVDKVKGFYDMYFEEDTCFGEMRHDDDPNVRKTWRSEKDKLKRFIEAYKPYCD